MEKLNWKPKTELEKAGLRIVQLLNKSNFQGFFVGGAVRDRILRRESDNLDIATDALPDEVEQILQQESIRYKVIGKTYGTILALIKGQKLEITTFRSESRYSDQRHPDKVEFIREYLEDAKRRDLTINTLYYNPVTQQLFDPVRGVQDIKRKLIRFVGDPKKRIDEDALRMLRAVRLAVTLDFRIEKKSFAAIKTRAKYIQAISGERVKAELDKILLSKNRSQGLRLLDSSGLLRFILPELVELKRVFHGSKKFHLEGDVFTHTLRVIDELPEDVELVYAGIFHDIGKSKRQQAVFKQGEWVNAFYGHQAMSARVFSDFADKYKFSRQSREIIDWLILHHDDRTNYKLMREDKMIKYSLHPDFPKLIDIWNADSIGNLRLGEKGEVKPGKSQSVKLARAILAKIASKQALIEKFANGKFIMQQTKLPQGIRIGQISEKIKVEIILGEIRNQQQAEKFLKKFAKKT